MNRNRPCSIGGVTFDNPFFLAPLAGVTDSPFRRICRQFGAGAVYTEMISAKGLYYNDKATERLLAMTEEEKPAVIQIFGSEPAVMAYAADVLADRDNCMLDINMGCPVPKVVKNGDGSAMMKDPWKVYDVVKAVALKARKPVTVKIRAGWDAEHINAAEVAKAAEAGGAAAVCVHGRTREQMYSGKADRSVIRRVREAVKIPVIGNGDITDTASAESMFQETGCDMIMIARGALGNPWLFRSLAEGRDYVPDKEERVETIRRHFTYLLEEKGEYIGVRCMRKHMGWYVKGIRGAVRIRRRINEIERAEEVYRELDQLLEQQEGV